MKNQYFLYAFFLFSAISLLGFTVNKNGLAKAKTLNTGPKLELPAVPYDYSLKIPDYLKNNINLVEKDAWNDVEVSNAKATLGRVLFYDKSLSKDGTVSCGSCHKQALAFADDFRFSDGINDIKTARNSPNLNDLGWLNKTGAQATNYFWDASESYLPEMVLKPIIHKGEFATSFEGMLYKVYNSAQYRELIEKAFGNQILSDKLLGEALAHFIESMASFDSKYDLVKDGKASFTDAESKGELVFNQHCDNCHAAPNFGLHVPLQNGFPFDESGHTTTTSTQIISGQFKSPSLRNIALTAPYMHGGEYESLERVIRFYSDSLVFSGQQPVYYGPTGISFNAAPMNLMPSEVDLLVAFLGTLTTPGLLTDEKWSDPFVDGPDDNSTGLDGAINVYPNPFSNTTTIVLDFKIDGKVELLLKSMNGQLLRKIQTETGIFVLEKGELSPGVYFLEINGGKKKSVQPIVIQ